MQRPGQFVLGAGGICADFESAEAHRQAKAFQLFNIIREFRELVCFNAAGLARNHDQWKWWKLRQDATLPCPGRSAIAGLVATSEATEEEFDDE